MNLLAAFGQGYGTVFQLVKSSHGWTFSLLHSFTSSEGGVTFGALALDAEQHLWSRA
jgi:hypothetical protein